MNYRGISDSVAKFSEARIECPSCGAGARLGNGSCVCCLLRAGVNEELRDEAVSCDDIEVRDTGWRLGNYQILEEIGRGGMGVIYRARQRHSKRVVALKRVLSYHGDSRDTLERFRREAEAAASLDHPNILPIYEVSESEGLPFFTMKYATGGSLQEVAPGLGAQPRECVRLLAKIARAVGYAHGEGILHRDLKPGNILLDARGEPMVSDFGLAKWIDANTDLTRSLTIFGTPGYIAPEQAQGPAAALTPTADVYSLGAILFDLLAGRPPFLGEHALAVIHQAAEKPAPKLRSLVPKADRDLETICAKCLEREPRARYRSASDLAEDLQRWLEGRPIVARPVSPPVRVWRWSKRNRVIAGTISGCVLLGGIATIQQISRSRLSQTMLESELARHSIAVSPFEDLNELGVASESARAITRQILSSLKSSNKLRVSFTADKFAEDRDFWSREDWQKIGESLHARYVITGTVRHGGDSIRIVARVIDVASGNASAPKIFEGPRSEITATAAARLVTEFEGNFAAQIKSDPALASPNLAARELVRTGIEYFFRYRPEDMRISLDYFQKAIDADPHFPLALAMQSLACTGYARVAPADEAETLARKAEAAAELAVRMDPQLALAHRALGTAAANRGDFLHAEESSLTAIEMDPTDLHPAGFVAYSLRLRGRPDLALRWQERSGTRGQRPGMAGPGIGDALADLGEDTPAVAAFTRFSEFHPDLPDGEVGLARIAMFHRDFEQARRECHEALTKSPAHTYPGLMLAQVEFFARNFAESARLYRELVKKDRYGGSSFYGCISSLSALAVSQARVGITTESELMLNDARAATAASISKAPQDRELVYDLAAIEIALGHRERGLALLDDAIAAGWIDYRSLAMDPRFDTVRDETRFKGRLQYPADKVERLRQQMPVLKLVQTQPKEQ